MMAGVFERVCEQNMHTPMPILHKEYRIILPFTTQKYELAQLYTVAILSSQESTGDTHVQILENTDTNHEVLGDCRKTIKIFSFGSKIPAIIRTFVPKSALTLTETSFNAFPRCLTFYKNHCFAESVFKITVNSFHNDGLEILENANNLPKDVIENTKTETIDICKEVVDKNYDPCKFVSEKNLVPKLTANWIEDLKNSGKEAMVCYKHVSIEVHSACLNWAIKHVEKSIRNLFLKAHQQMFCEIDKWYDLTIQDVRKIEEDTQKELERKSKSI